MILTLPKELYETIFDYISCKHRKHLMISSKTIKDILKCKMQYFHFQKCNKIHQLFCCKTHEKNILYKIEAITVLNQNKNKKNISTIHFSNSKAREIAYPFAKNFGNISHCCCDGKGIMFKDNQKPPLYYNYYNI